MKLILKNKIDILDKKVNIGIGYKVVFNEERSGFIDFDIDDEKILNHDILNNNLSSLYNSSLPIFVSISMLLFEKNQKIDFIMFETEDMTSKIKRKDLFN